MKRYLIAIGVIITSSLAGIGIGKVVADETAPSTPSYSANPTTFPTPTGTPSPTLLTTPAPTVAPAEPARLHIPALQIDTAIETVGLDSVGNMDVPKESDNVAWYKHGPKPGEKGNAAIAGHYDWTDGPAVFYELHTLTPGSELTIVDTAGQEHVFVVAEQEEYPYDQLPIQKVFGQHSGIRLNLITCSGSFDQASQNYSHRIVVYATKKI